MWPATWISVITHRPQRKHALSASNHAEMPQLRFFVGGWSPSSGFDCKEAPRQGARNRYSFADVYQGHVKARQDKEIRSLLKSMLTFLQRCSTSPVGSCPSEKPESLFAKFVEAQVALIVEAADAYVP